MHIVDLNQEDVIVTYLSAGKRIVLSRDDLLERLGPTQALPSAPDTITQHALGRALAHLLVAVKAGTVADLEGRLLRLLNRFDGRCNPTPSRIPGTLEVLADAAPNIRGAVDQFLRTYPLKGRNKSQKALKVVLGVAQ